MHIFRRNPLVLAFAAATVGLWSTAATSQPAPDKEPRAIQDQGSLAVGGSVATAPGDFDPKKPLEPSGQTFHGDHLYAFYQITVDARALPIVMWHGAGQFSKTWETTPDGREGFQNIFLRRKFATYLIDQPTTRREKRSITTAR